MTQAISLISLLAFASLLVAHPVIEADFVVVSTRCQSTRLRERLGGLLKFYHRQAA
jgi:hypothetical protein